MVPSRETSIYRDMMRFKPDGMTANGWAVRAGVSRTVWADMRRHGNPSRRTLEKLLTAAGSSLAEFEAMRLGAEPQPPQSAPPLVGDAQRWGWKPAPPLPLPLIAASLAGDWSGPTRDIEMIAIDASQQVGRLPRPSSLADDRAAYAVTIVGTSMWPRFRTGSQVAVSPSMPIAIGDDVLVRLHAAEIGESTSALIKQLVRRGNDALELRQFTPDLTFAIELDEVEAIHRIVGELI